MKRVGNFVIFPNFLTFTDFAEAKAFIIIWYSSQSVENNHEMFYKLFLKLLRSLGGFTSCAFQSFVVTFTNSLVAP